MAMKGTRKNPAVKKYAEMLAETQDEAATLEALKADDKEYTEDEVNEIWLAVTAEPEMVEAPKAITKAEKPSPYKRYDKWLVSCDAIQVPDDSPVAKYRVTFVKIRRANRPIEERTAELLNKQTQNNSTYYALSGTVNNGDEITIEVSRGKTR